MAYKRERINVQEKRDLGIRKKFVRYDEGAEFLSMGLHSFQTLAKEAGAIYHPTGCGRMVLVNIEEVERYLERACKAIEV